MSHISYRSLRGTWEVRWDVYLCGERSSWLAVWLSIGTRRLLYERTSLWVGLADNQYFTALIKFPPLCHAAPCSTGIAKPEVSFGTRRW